MPLSHPDWPVGVQTPTQTHRADRVGLVSAAAIIVGGCLLLVLQTWKSLLALTGSWFASVLTCYELRSDDSPHGWLDGKCVWILVAQVEGAWNLQEETMSHFCFSCLGTLIKHLELKQPCQWQGEAYLELPRSHVAVRDGLFGSTEGDFLLVWYVVPCSRRICQGRIS